jgi:hypothetical protein
MTIVSAELARRLRIIDDLAQQIKIPGTGVAAQPSIQTD